MNEKKLEIVKKVWELYRQYGIRSVTMDDVVKELGISKKTLYQYFNDKTEMVHDVMEYDYASKKQDFSECFDKKDNAVEELINYSLVQLSMITSHRPSLIYDLKKYYPDLFNKFQDKKREQMLNGLLMNLQRGKAEGLYRKEINEELIARLNLTRVEGMLNSKLFRLEELMSKEFFREAFTYHAYGIVSDEGRKILEQNLDKLK